MAIVSIGVRPFTLSAPLSPIAYRSAAFAFAWVERILRAKDRELSTAAAISTLHTTWLGVQEAGFEAIVVGQITIGSCTWK